MNVLLENEISPIFCCGELLEERENKQEYEVVKSQITQSLFHLTKEEIANVIIAYEPVWAIGTGLTATPEEAEQMHAYIRKLFSAHYGESIAENLSILYGGSCNSKNAREIFSKPNVDGGLIGGASLKPEEFYHIYKSFLNTMNYVAVKFECKNLDFDWEILIAFLAEIGYETFEEIENGLKAYIPAPDFDRTKIKNLLKDKFEKMDIWYNYETINDRNWNEVWESNYEPIVISDRCLIRAPFHPANNSMEFDILIEPQMSFGTAHHETTAMMIEYILDMELSDKQILDMGSGTGVLAILASMKSAEMIDAIDIDEWAFKNCISNTEKNNIKNINVIQGDANAIVKKYDVIFANINLNILVRDMEIYANALKTGGEIYFSGFYQNDLIKLEQAAGQSNLQLIDSKVKNSWMAAKFLKTK